MPSILVAVAVVLLVLWALGHVIGALLHLLFWLIAAAPYVAILLIVAALVMRASDRRSPRL